MAKKRDLVAEQIWRYFYHMQNGRTAKRCARFIRTDLETVRAKIQKLLKMGALTRVGWDQKSAVYEIGENSPVPKEA